MTRSHAARTASNCDRLSRQFKTIAVGQKAEASRRRAPPPPEVALQRLLPRYERHIGADPGIAGLDAERAVAAMRRELSAVGALAGGRATAALRH